MYSEIKTHGRVSTAKKDVRLASVLFIGTTKSPFSTSHTYNYWTYFYQIYIFYVLHIHHVILHTKFEENWISSLQDMCF